MNYNEGQHLVVGQPEDALAASTAIWIPDFDTRPNHHLWNNHGIWFANYTIYPTPITKERVRHTLKTRNVETARRRRDRLLARVEAEGLLAKAKIGSRCIG